MTVLYAILLVAFYPIVPIVAYLNLLWNKVSIQIRIGALIAKLNIFQPKDPHRMSPKFLEAEYIATVAHAISGGIESPVQIAFQCWMIFNGIIRIDWGSVSGKLLMDC